MRSRVVRRRGATALGIYGGAVVGFLATIVAARELSKDDFARFALVFATTSLLQLFVDLTIDEVVVKYGNRYAAREDWGRFRRLFEIAFGVKVAGGAVGSIAVAAAALASPWLFSLDGLRTPMLVAALIPLVQAPEGIAGAALLVRNRYDVRGLLLLLSMSLRLAAIAYGARHGIVTLFGAIVGAQVLATAAALAAGAVAYRRFPSEARRPLAEDAREIRRFAVQSTIASGLTSLRTLLPTVLVGVVARKADVANFRVAQAPQTAFAALSAPARLVLLAEQTRDIERGDVGRALRLLRRYIVGTSAVAVVAVPLLWVAMPTLIRWVYEPRYLGATDATRLILVAAAVQLVFGWSRSFPVSVGRPGLRTAAQVVELVVLVPALLLLGRAYGATGAAGGVLVGTLAFALFWTVALVHLRGRVVRTAPTEAHA